MELRSESVLRGAGLIGWAGVCLQGFVSVRFRVGSRMFVDSRALEIAFAVLILGSFGAAFAWLTGPGLYSHRRWLRALLLLVQSAIGTFLLPNLFLIVAMSLPFVYRPRVALLWLAARDLVALPFFVYLVQSHPEAFGGAEGPPLFWRVALGALPDLTWTLLAFAVGLIGASERARRADLARVNAALLGAQRLLADRARLEERLEIARELHDSIGHHLASLHVQLELAQHISAEPALTAVRRARDLSKSLLQEVREVVTTFRSESPLDLYAALEKLAASIEQPAIMLRVEPGLRVDDPVHARAVLRCAQEFVTNTLRHGDADHVWLELSRQGHQLCLHARDDGRGRDEIVLGNGLRGICERAELLEGSVAVDSRPGHGFTLELRIPSPEESA